MSASTEKKNRVEARAAGTDRKAKAAAEAAKKAKESKRNWTIGVIATVFVVALIILFNSNFIYTNTTAVKVGDVSYSPAQVSYYYASQYMTFVNNYGSYASYFGLDTSTGISGLDEQECTMLEEGSTWKDYFMDSALTQLEQYTVIEKYANENGIELNDEEIAEVDSEFEGMEETVESYGFTSVDNYFSYNYGKGVTEKLVREEALRAELVQKAYNAYSDSLEYTDEELAEYYAGLNGSSDIFDYVYYAVYAEEETSTDEEGNETSEATDETKAAAKATAEAILTAYKADKETSDEVERLDAAILAAGDDGTSVHSTTTTGSNLNSAYSEWMLESRTAGDVTLAENSDASAYYVVVYLGRDDNSYQTVNVRHILIKAEEDEDGEYTDEAIQAAHDKAQEIYDEFLAGDMTAESFAALAEEYSEDTGSNTNGGLYEEVYKNEMVTEFNDFCFAEGRVEGDSGMVDVTSTSYAGTHIIFIDGFGEEYCNVIARDALSSEDLESWMEGLLDGNEAETCGAMRYVGKT